MKLALDLAGPREDWSAPTKILITERTRAWLASSLLPPPPVPAPLPARPNRAQRRCHEREQRRANASKP